MAAILGFMPLLDRRRSIPTRSGTAAKVVPKPAIKPMISERFKARQSTISTRAPARSTTAKPRALSSWLAFGDRVPSTHSSKRPLNPAAR